MRARMAFALDEFDIGRAIAEGLSERQNSVGNRGKYEVLGHRWAMGGEMKVSVVILFALLIAATAIALAFGHSTMTASVSAVASQAAAGSGEPAFMLLSGSALLGLAGALKRFTF
jgi:hypothetical protein